MGRGNVALLLLALLLSTAAVAVAKEAPTTTYGNADIDIDNFVGGGNNQYVEDDDDTIIISSSGSDNDDGQHQQEEEKEKAPFQPPQPPLRNICPTYSTATLVGGSGTTTPSWPVHLQCNLDQYTSMTMPLFRGTNNNKPQSSQKKDYAQPQLVAPLLVSDVSPLRDVSHFGAAHWHNGSWTPISALQRKVDDLAVLRSEGKAAAGGGGRAVVGGRGKTTTKSTPPVTYEGFVSTWGSVLGTVAYSFSQLKQLLWMPVDFASRCLAMCSSWVSWVRAGRYKPYLNTKAMKALLHNFLTYISDTLLWAAGFGEALHNGGGGEGSSNSGVVGTAIRVFNSYVRPSRILQAFSVVIVNVQYPIDWGKTNVAGRQGGIAESTPSLFSSSPRGGLSARIYIASPMRVVKSKSDQTSTPSSYVGKSGADLGDKMAIHHEALFGDNHHNTPLTCEAWSLYPGPHLHERRRLAAVEGARALTAAQIAAATSGMYEEEEEDNVGNDGGEAAAFHAERTSVQGELLGLHQEVCAPPTRGGIPQWLKKLVRPSIHHTLTVFQESPLELAKKHAATMEKIPTLPPPISRNVSCDIYLPYNTLGCLRIESIYPNRPVAGLSVNVLSVWDVRWLSLFAGLIVLSVVKPYMLASQPLQVLATAFLGIGFVGILLLFLAFNELRKSRIGKVGILALITTGGAVGYSETAITILWNYLVDEIYTNVYLQLAVAACAVVAFLLSKYVFYDKVPLIASSTMTLAQIFICCTMASHNRDATFLAAPLFLAVYFPWVLNVLAVPILLVIGITKLVFSMLLFPFAYILSAGAAPNPFDNIPRDSFSPEDLLPRGYCRPIAADAIQGANTAEKFQAYSQQGSEATRRALDELAAHIRTNPSKYVSRVRDPGGIARFAGVSDE